MSLGAANPHPVGTGKYRERGLLSEPPHASLVALTAKGVARFCRHVLIKKSLGHELNRPETPAGAGMQKKAPAAAAAASSPQKHTRTDTHTKKTPEQLLR